MRRTSFTSLAALLALAVATLSSFTAPSVVSVSGASPAREPIAHTMITQTTGPTGTWASPNNVMPWGLDRLDSRGPNFSEARLDNSYTYSSDGTGVKIYVLDSGVSAGHSEFGSRVVDGWSYRSALTALNSYKANRAVYDTDAANSVPESQRRGIAPCSRTWNPDGSSTPMYRKQQDPAVFDAPASVDATDKGKSDNDGHGTHVAGIAAGTTTGVAKNATIVPVRALDSCGVGSARMVTDAIDWILLDHQLGEKAVVNMSIGFDSQASDVNNRIAGLMAEGMLVVAAAGNSATSSCNTTPAGTAGTFSVGAMGSTDNEANFSNYGDCVAIFAPGYSILSSWPYLESVSGGTPVTNGWWAQSGTSMAAPHVTGALARWLQGQTLTTSSANDVSTNAWTWLKNNATCDAVSYYGPSRSPQTANRMLTLGATAQKPCGPREVAVATASQAATIGFTASATGNGAAVTSYTVTLSPGGATCTIDPSVATEPYSCPFTGLNRASAYSYTVTATNSVGVGPARTGSFTTPGLPPAPTGLTATAGDHEATFSWGGTVVGATYTVTLTPGGATCAVVGTTCTITGLANGQTYTASVVGVNANGTGTASSTVTVLPDGTPEAPSIRLAASNRSVTVTWLAVTNYVDVTYVVTASPGGLSCTTTGTSCTVTGLSNGVEYSFSIAIRTGTGKVASSAAGSPARPGFTIKKTAVKKGSKTLLTSIVVPVSKGRKSWSEKGACSIAAGRLVAPRKVTTCTLTLKVARYGAYAAASTKVVIAVR